MTSPPPGGTDKGTVMENRNPVYQTVRYDIPLTDTERQIQEHADQLCRVTSTLMSSVKCLLAYASDHHAREAQDLCSNAIVQALCLMNAIRTSVDTED